MNLKFSGVSCLLVAAGYDLLTREYLAGQLLERELAQINSKVKSEIEKESNLTLGLLNHSIILFIINLLLILITNYKIIKSLTSRLLVRIVQFGTLL